MRNATRSFLLLFIFVLVGSSFAFPNMADGCNENGCVEELTVSNRSTHDGSQAEHTAADCHCPVHHHGCHSNVMMGRNATAYSYLLINRRAFDDAYIFSFSSPFLESPFQPPKA